jgi:hypothetical protein
LIHAGAPILYKFISADYCTQNKGRPHSWLKRHSQIPIP